VSYACLMLSVSVLCVSYVECKCLMLDVFMVNVVAAIILLLPGAKT
jgi:hypothetical protein